MKLKDGEKERSVSKIAKVKELDSGYEVTKSDGWCVWIEKKYGVKPMVNDTIIIYGKPSRRIQGIQINDKILFLKTDKQMKNEHRDFVKKMRKEHAREYKELMKKIRDEEPFETVDISGMSGGYERGCQLMLRAGIKFLKEHPDFHFDYQSFKNVYGLCWSDTPWGKQLDKVLMDAVEKEGGCTGAMHQAVIGHLQYIHRHGYKKWLEQFPKKRRYTYPLELPKPKF